MSRIVQKGERLVITHGCYSDYKILTVAEAVESFSIDFVHKEYMTWAAAKDVNGDNREYKFLAWLVSVRGLLVEVPVNWREWHFGDDGLNDNDYDIGPWRDVESSWRSEWPGKYAAEEVEKVNG
jgi:hypothetical protein